jgi:hypothetical protein
MSPVTAACPGCGAAVEFRHDDSFVRVCSYCNAVVARADRGFESLGRMGDLAASESPLALHASGVLSGVGFQLVGRAQIAHPRGGGWEEWYARFDNGTWGWLSEAQGRFQLTFGVPPPPTLPPFEWLVPGLGLALALPGHEPETFTVSEVGAAAYRAAAGEMPYKLEPGLRFRFADLSGERGGFATIDAGVEPGDPVAVYVGREVTLADLQIAPGSGGSAGSAPAVTRVSAHHVACVQCGGSLELRAPGASLRVTCPYCAAVLDVDQGHLSYLRTLDRTTETFRPEIPLGTIAELGGHSLTVIGCLGRSVRVDGVDYPFTEYLLYHPSAGYRWLVESDHHWSYVSPIAAGAVGQLPDGAEHAKRRFRHFQTAEARVNRIFGEFTWKVELGERAVMSDFVCPPFMLSSEEGRGEIHWSLCVWMDARELARRLEPPGGAPGSITLPDALSVAPHQPFRHRGMLKLTIGLSALLLAAGLAMKVRAASREIDLRFESAAEEPAPASPAAPLPGGQPQPSSRIVFSEPFELTGGENIEVALETQLVNSWLYAVVDLVSEDTGVLESFVAQLESYHGVEDGEAWSEGNPGKTVHMAPMPGGRYVLRLETYWPAERSSPGLRVTVRQGVFRGIYLLAALGALLVFPILIGLRWLLFEKQRWSESDHPWFRGSGDE